MMSKLTRALKYCTLVLAAIFILTGCNGGSSSSESPQKIGADTVVRNGLVYTVDSSNPWSEAIAIKDGRILKIGNNEDVANLIGSNTKVTDLDGKLVIPGFVDSHSHPVLSAALANPRILPLNPVDTPTAWLDTLANFGYKNPDLDVLFSFGFNPLAFGSDGPTKSMIDERIADRPVIMLDAGGHSAWLNSKALETLNITKDTPDPIPGLHRYVRDENGVPTGWLLESQTIMPALKKLGAITEMAIFSGAEKLFPIFSQSGITTMFDAGMFEFEDEGYSALLSLEKNNNLPIRIVGSHMVTNPAMVDSAISSFLKIKDKVKESNLVDIGAIKLHNDGTIEAHTAALLSDYSDSPGYSGAMLLEGQVLRDFISNTNKKSIDLHIHSIGDRTTQEVLDAIRETKSSGNKDVRYTMAHLDLIPENSISAFKELNVIAQTTPFWFSYSDIYEEVIGKERQSKTFRFKSLIDQGVKVSFGSDYPATGHRQGFNPFLNIQVGLTRQNSNDPTAPILGNAAEKLSLAELIEGYTLNAAYQLRMENDIGSLKEGKLADFIVLSDNIFTVDPYKIKDTTVVSTYLNGHVIPIK